MEVQTKTNNYKYVALVLLGLFIGSVTTYYITKNKWENKNITINVPGVKGISDTIYKPTPIVSVKDHFIYQNDTIKTENPFNKDLANKYTDLEKRYAGIELEKERLKSYLKAIEIKDYVIPFEDDFIKIKNNIKAQGEVLSFQQDYEIKPREIKTEVPIKKEGFNFYAGAEIGNNKEFNNFTVKGNIFMQIPKGDMINISYTSDKNYYLGYTFKF